MKRKPWRSTYPRPVCWDVMSPEYETYSMSWDPPEPPEYGRDFLYVWARSAHRAKVLAIRAWRRGWWRGLRRSGRKTITQWEPYIVRYDDENPMRAVTVERLVLTR